MIVEKLKNESLNRFNDNFAQAELSSRPLNTASDSDSKTH